MAKRSEGAHRKRAAGLALAAGLAFATTAHGQADTLRIGLVAAGADTAGLVHGVRLGVEEAARSATLLGRAVELYVDADAETLVERDRVQALVGGREDDECRRLAKVAEARGVLFLNVGCAADALRGAECRRSAFHVAPSEAMLGEAAGGGGRAMAWHPSLERFGAEQLRDRHRARFGEEMDSQGWAGWFAVKVLWESTLRARSADPAALIAHIERESTQFDGHKGRPLSFRPWDHQLRQPLYAVSPSGEVAEVPSAPRESGIPSKELLDRIGTTAAETACRWNSGR
ncbi:MAG TPA: ABC transporter substrate-binding protein [Longimicrobium sp.]|nr:ABC transporter substrate-binding protein [Longimicrobium sp.]